MKKLGIVLAVLILVALPAVPFVNGILMEKTLRQAIENINQIYADAGSDMRLGITEYDRRLFDTRIQWRVDFGSLAGVYGVKDVILVDKADHGFLGITSNTSLEKNIWYSDWVRTKLKGNDPLKIRTRYSAIGPITSVITLDGFSLEQEKGVVNIGGLEFKASFDKAFESFTTTGRWDGLAENDTNKMGAVTFEAAHKKITNLIWQGKGAMTVDDVTADEDGVSLALSGLVCTYDLTADPDHEKMSMGMGMRADKVVFNGQSLSEWSIDWAVNNVDIPAYEALTKIYYQIINTHMAQATRPDLPPGEAGAILQRAMAQNAPQLMGGLEKLLKRDLEIKISNLNMELPQGKIKGNFSMGLKQDVTMARLFLLAAQPNLVLDILSLQSECILPLSLVGDRQEMTVPAFSGMKTGLFVQEQEILKHRAQIRDNKLYLNGQEVLLDF